MKSFLTWISITTLFTATLFALIIYVGTDSTASLVLNSDIKKAAQINTQDIQTKSYTSINPMLIEKSVREGDLNSLRKITNASSSSDYINISNRKTVKRYLLNNINNIDQNYIKRLRTVDLELGNYINTSKKLLSESKKIKSIENIITPLAMTSADYEYSNILDDEVFVHYYREQKTANNTKLFLDFRENNKNDLSGAFSLLAQTEITDEIRGDVKMLFLQLVKAPASIRVLAEEKFLESYQRISTDTGLNKYLEYTTVTYLLDNIENKEKYDFYLSKINPKSKYYKTLNNKASNKLGTQRNDKEVMAESEFKSEEQTGQQRAMLKVEEKESFVNRSLDTGTENKRKSSFSFGWVLVLFGLLYFGYKKISTRFKKTFKQQQTDYSNKESNSNTEELEFDEDLSLDLG